LGEKPLKAKQVEKDLYKYFNKIKPFIKEVFPLIFDAIDKDKNILAEGAHGMFLDNDWGTYPFVTASNVLISGITAGSGIPAQKINRVIGISKAYTTRVGSGPFPTELFDKNGDLLVEKGNEYGTTTGRRRRTGWFDAELIRFAAKINGLTEIAITKLDILDDFKEIKICTHYILNKKKVAYIDGDAIFLGKVKPVYKTLPGWQSSTRGITKYNSLPINAKKYLREIEKQINVKIGFISTGQNRKDTIIL